MFPILIVDDSREDLELAARVFAQAKIANPIHSLNSGAACVEFIRKRYSGDSPPSEPCLILLDMAMPGMTGTQTIAALNEVPFGPAQWILMLSGLNDVKLVRDGYQLGARTFLTKPLTVRDLMDFFNSNSRSIKKQMMPDGYVLSWSDAVR